MRTEKFSTLYESLLESMKKSHFGPNLCENDLRVDTMRQSWISSYNPFQWKIIRNLSYSGNYFPLKAVNNE